MEQVLLILFVGIIYFIPSFWAMDKRNTGAIFALNLFLGWTFVGWVGALIWAIMDKEPVRKPKQILKVSMCGYCLHETRTTVEGRCVECQGMKS
jgi:hypothetical protein